MPLLYRGVANGTHWHRNDARVSGFTAHSRGISHSVNIMMMHICQATVFTPYISLTSSLGVACSYAGVASSGMATAASPGYVYTIDIPNPLPPDIQLYDAVHEIATTIPSHLPQTLYQHEGRPEYLLGVADSSFSHHLLSYYFDPAGHLTSQNDAPSQYLRTLVHALRDAELLAYDSIPAKYIKHRIAVP
jgi:hypothetical protein